MTPLSTPNCTPSLTPPAGYRLNAGICITNGKGLVLAGEREDIPNAWQCPQGGIDADETPEAAAWRELREETGLTKKQATLTQTHSHWLTYNFPAAAFGPESYTTGYNGQTQKWFLFTYTGELPKPEAAETPEFSQFKWVEPAWLVKNVVAFRQGIYGAMLREFGLL